MVSFSRLFEKSYKGIEVLIGFKKVQCNKYLYSNKKDDKKDTKNNAKFFQEKTIKIYFS